MNHTDKTYQHTLAFINGNVVGENKINRDETSMSTANAMNLCHSVAYVFDYY